MQTSARFGTNGRIVAEAPLVYLDANFFIYALEGEDERSEPLQAFLRELRRRPGIAITSELTLAEVLVKPQREHDFDLKRRYISLLLSSRAIELRPVSRDVLIESARYRAVAYPNPPAPIEDRRNFLPDAIHIVTAIQNRCSYFIANDTRLRLPAEMQRLSPIGEDLRPLIARLGA